MRPPTHPRLRAALFALFAALLVAGPRPARADAWSEARSAFRRAQASKDWKERAEGYRVLVEQDRAETVDDVLSALLKEQNGAVVWAGVKALAGLRSAGATEALASAVRKEKGARRQWALLAARDVPGDAAKAALAGALKEAMAGTDPQASALAMLALGRMQAQDALPGVLERLKSPDARLRSAAARAIRSMAGTSSVGAPRPEERSVPVPAWVKDAKLAGPLAEALAAATGRDRQDLIDALERVTGQAFGWDVEAWKALAGGADPASIPKKPSYPPHFFGIPVHGRRVVAIVDHSLCTDDPHPFQDQARLRELCKVPGGRDVPWYDVRLTGQLIGAHVKRLVSDLPEGSAFDLVLVGKSVKSAMGKLVPATTGSKGAAAKAIDELKVENGMDVLSALHLALDAGGAKDDMAWRQGPEEIVLATCSVPWLAEVTEPAVIGATIALKARLRGVAVHTVGVGSHPFDMMTLVSDQSGGRYVDRSK